MLFNVVMPDGTIGIDKQNISTACAPESPNNEIAAECPCKPQADDDQNQRRQEDTKNSANRWFKKWLLHNGLTSSSATLNGRSEATGDQLPVR